MVDYMLKFDSKEQAETTLVQLGFANRTISEDSEGIVGILPHTIDVIGILRVPGIPPPSNNITVINSELHIDLQFVDLEGYHINLRTVTEYPELEPYKVFPSTPLRVWA